MDKNETTHYCIYRKRTFRPSTTADCRPSLLSHRCTSSPHICLWRPPHSYSHPYSAKTTPIATKTNTGHRRKRFWAPEKFYGDFFQQLCSENYDPHPTLLELFFNLSLTEHRPICFLMRYDNPTKTEMLKHATKMSFTTPYFSNFLNVFEGEYLHYNCYSLFT